VRDVVIPKGAATDVFHGYTLPKEYEKTMKAFPGARNLHPDVQGALVSLVYNRGTAMDGDRFREMRDIRGCVASGDIRGIAAALRRMKRLWERKGLGGLLRRRDAEADLVEGTLA
jgi:GH24 family phage-related lysozyme (muramidase)